MRRTGSAPSNFCPLMTQRLGSMEPTLLAIWSAMQISRTQVFGHSSAILMPVLTSFYFPFRLLRRKNEFLNLVRSNEDIGNDYITELTPPTAEEIRNARPLATVLPHHVLTHVMLIATTLCAGS